MALTYKTLSQKKFLFIFLSCLLFQQLTAQTIVKFDNGNNIIYKNLQGKTIVKNKKYTIAFTDTISSIGFVGTRKGEIVCINNAGKELFEVYKIDNGPDYVSDGLFRIVGKNSKIGFADTCGAIVIPPVFSYATPFHNGEAKVSFGGKNEKQGEYQSWKSNLWFLIKKSKQFLKALDMFFNRTNKSSRIFPKPAAIPLHLHDNG